MHAKRSKLTTSARSAAKAILKKVAGNYACYKIFCLDLDDADINVELDPPYRFAELQASDLLDSNHELIRKCAWYAGSDSQGFGIFRDETLVCIQWYWYGERYRTRNFWPLENDEAKSVELATIPSERGKGLATRLKQYSARRMRQRGFVRLYSRVWCTNRASIRVSEKTGWHHEATVIRVHPFGGGRAFRFTFKTRRGRRRRR